MKQLEHDVRQHLRRRHMVCTEKSVQLKRSVSLMPFYNMLGEVLPPFGGLWNRARLSFSAVHLDGPHQRNVRADMPFWACC